jgi:hypothetical protein
VAYVFDTGDLLNYTITLQNTGNIFGNLSAAIEATGLTCSPSAVLVAPQAFVNCTGFVHTVTQSDLNFGNYTADVDFDIIGARNANLTDAGTLNITTQANQMPGLNVTEALLSGGNYDSPGKGWVISYATFKWNAGIVLDLI